MTFITEILENESVRAVLADHYRSRVAQAVDAYEESAADEDSLTGALGQALRGTGRCVLGGGRVIHWTTRYRKLRGRGRNAPEKRLGADGLFEIELEDEQNLRSRKTLPFQAKNNASGYGDARLREQAGRLAEFPGGGIIVNYRPGGYVAVDARLAANGRATREMEVALGDSLGTDFVWCRRGSTEYFFELALGGLLLFHGPLIFVRRWSPQHRIRTSLRIVSGRR